MLWALSSVCGYLILLPFQPVQKEKTVPSPCEEPLAPTACPALSKGSSQGGGQHPRSTGSQQFCWGRSRSTSLPGSIRSPASERRLFAQVALANAPGPGRTPGAEPCCHREPAPHRDPPQKLQELLPKSQPMPADACRALRKRTEDSSITNQLVRTQEHPGFFTQIHAYEFIFFFFLFVAFFCNEEGWEFGPALSKSRCQWMPAQNQAKALPFLRCANLFCTKGILHFYGLKIGLQKKKKKLYKGTLII